MKTTRITNGVNVRCSDCGKYHTVYGFRGNNQRWYDKLGWSGSFDCAHGFFESCRAHTLCPIHTAEMEKINSEIENFEQKEKNMKWTKETLEKELASGNCDIEQGKCDWMRENIEQVLLELEEYENLEDGLWQYAKDCIE